MTDVATISAKIVTMLGTLSNLNGVYDYRPDKPTSGQYPYAVVIQNEFSGRFGDTIRNIRIYTFKVSVFQERVSFGNSKAERLTREIIDAILTLFDNNTTLGGMVLFVKPVRGNLNYEDSEIGDTRVAEFFLECEKAVDSVT